MDSLKVHGISQGILETPLSTIGFNTLVEPNMETLSTAHEQIGNGW
jgi:hypothetical protein